MSRRGLNERLSPKLKVPILLYMLLSISIFISDIMAGSNIEYRESPDNFYLAHRGNYYLAHRPSISCLEKHECLRIYQEDSGTLLKVQSTEQTVTHTDSHTH